MKKILILNGSIRKRNTFNLLKRIEHILTGFEIEFVNIMDFKLQPCIGCENCLRRGDCRITDDAEQLLEKMSRADGIVIGSPVYLRQISGYVKILIDRGCAWYHRSPLAGKPVFFAATTQASGLKQTAAYFNDLALQWGTINCGCIARTMFNIDKKIPSKNLDKFLFYSDPANREFFRPGLKEILEFNTQKLLAAWVLPLDREYWTEKGYINRPYYYNCRINPFFRLAGFIYFSIASFFMKKSESGGS